MPAAKEYINNPDNPEYKKLMVAAEDELKVRRSVFEKNLKYYMGEHRQWLKVGADGINDNVTVNLTKTTVDRKISFLFPQMPSLTINDDGQTDEAEKALADVWIKNGGASLLNEFALMGSLSGHVFVRLAKMPDTDEIVIMTMPTSHVLRYWNQDNYRDTLWYEVYWKAGGLDYKQEIVPDGARWILATKVKKGQGWEAVPDGEEIWPYELSPVVAWGHKPKQNSPYGDHEFNHAGLNDFINLQASNIAKILRFHAHPITVVDDPSISKDSFLDSGPSKLLKVKPGAKVYNVEMQSDLQSSMNFLNWLEGKYLEQSKVVILPSDARAFANVTNFGVQAAFLPMSDDNGVLQRSYGWGIAEISKRVLMLQNVSIEREVSVTFADALPTNQLENTNKLIAQYNAGFVARRQASEALGYNFDKVNEYNSEDADFAGTLADRYMNLNPPMGGE